MHMWASKAVPGRARPSSSCCRAHRWLRRERRTQTMTTLRRDERPGIADQAVPGPLPRQKEASMVSGRMNWDRVNRENRAWRAGKPRSERQLGALRPSRGGPTTQS